MVAGWHYNWVNHLIGLAATSNVWRVSEIQCQVVITYYDNIMIKRYHDPTRLTWRCKPPLSLLRHLGFLLRPYLFSCLHHLLILYHSFSHLKSASSRDSRTTLTSQVRLDKIYIYTSTLSAQRTKFSLGAALTTRFLSRGRPERERRSSNPSNQSNSSILGSHLI